MVIQTVLSKNLERNLFSLKKKNHLTKVHKHLGFSAKQFRQLKYSFLKKTLLVFWQYGHSTLSKVFSSFKRFVVCFQEKRNMEEEAVSGAFVVLQLIQCGVGYGLSSFCVKTALMTLIRKNQVCIVCILGIFLYNYSQKYSQC